MRLWPKRGPWAGRQLAALTYLRDNKLTKLPASWDWAVTSLEFVTPQVLDAYQQPQLGTSELVMRPRDTHLWSGSFGSRQGPPALTFDRGFRRPRHLPNTDDGASANDPMNSPHCDASSSPYTVGPANSPQRDVSSTKGPTMDPQNTASSAKGPTMNPQHAVSLAKGPKISSQGDASRSSPPPPLENISAAQPRGGHRSGKPSMTGKKETKPQRSWEHHSWH